MRALLGLLCVAAISLSVTTLADPNDIGFWAFVYRFLEDTLVLEFVQKTCLLTAGVIVFDILYLPAVDTWRLIRFGTVKSKGQYHILSEERIRSTLGYQRVVVGCFIIGLALILY